MKTAAGKTSDSRMPTADNCAGDTFESAKLTKQEASFAARAEQAIVWPNVFKFTLFHCLALYALTWVPTASWEMLLFSASLWWWSGLGITAGAHRLWSHKSFKAHFPLRVFLMLLNSMAFQGDIFEWARDHRTHHKGSETDADPHNATRGFWYSHCGWIFYRKHRDVYVAGKKIDVRDLVNDPVVMWQQQYYFPSVFLMCYGVPTLGGYFLGSAWHGFWLGGMFRHVWVLHMTWCVNSFAHLFGDRPYDPKINPAENLFVSICAIGEGWHNYHHRYPHDYAASELGIGSGTWNPTKLFIDVCVILGLAYDRRRSHYYKVKHIYGTDDAKHQTKQQQEVGKAPFVKEAKTAEQTQEPSQQSAGETSSFER